MEKLAVLGLFCSGDGFTISLEYDGACEEVASASKTSDGLALEIINLLQKHGLTSRQIGTIVVCIGPGSFTGSRVAVSFAKGFACGNPKVKLVGFNTFDFYSYNAKADLCIVPAFSNLVYVYANDQMSCITQDEAVNVAKGKRVVCPAELAKALSIEAIEPNSSLAEFALNKAKEKSVKVNDLRPIYLRASQAEIEREKRLKNGTKN